MTATAQKIKQAQEKSIEWIEYFATRPEAELVKRLHINHAQYSIAVKEKKEDVCELLNIMERILIEAQLYKADNNIPDTPTEIELAIEEMEMLVQKEEERMETFRQVQGDKKEELIHIPEARGQERAEETKPLSDTSEQLSLF